MSEIVLTTKQQEGLELAVARYRAREPYTCISGFAGSGKSTLVKFIVEALGLQKYEVCYVAYTGKASLVLREKGCPNAMTAHKLLYQSFPKPDGPFFHRVKRPIDPYKLIVVDEISMLPKEMWDLLLSHRIHVIALGDPFQLPPIGEDNGVLKDAHIFLDEIMRQAQESEIIRLTMDIRAGKPLELFKGKEVQVIDKSELVNGMFFWANQIICAKNETRHWVNDLVRKYKYGANVSPEPVIGDKVICLRNEWEEMTEAGDVLVNGTTGTVTSISKGRGNRFEEAKLTISMLPDGYTAEEYDEYPYDVSFRNLHIDHKLITKKEPTVNKGNFKLIPPKLRPYEFDYGYCITCHKSQGSEYDNVLVFEEHLKGGDHARWLYTAATRAKKKLVIVRAG